MKTTKTVTIEQVIAWEPCGLRDENDSHNYTPERIQVLFAGRESLTAHDILVLDIPHQHKLWALLHNEFFTDHEMHALACDFAEHVVSLCGDDKRPATAIEAKRAWLRGDIDDEQLAAAWNAAEAATWATWGAWGAVWAAGAARAAAEDTARAAWNAAEDATRAARAAAGDTARAARAAARAAEEEWQIQRIIVLITGEETI